MNHQQAVEAAQAALDAWDEAHQIGSTDPGLQSMRFHESQKSMTKSLTGYLNLQRRLSQERERLVDAVSTARRNHRIAQLPTEPVDPTLIKAATRVLVRERYRTVWYEIKRVNAKTVTCKVEPGYDEPRIPFHLIVGAK